MKNIDAFSGYNPVVSFIFYIGAIVFSVVFVHPAFMICSLVISSIYYIILKGSRAGKLLLGMVPVFILVSIINPILNTSGSHVIFTYFSGRPYTLEALLYGMAVAVMFISVILWFASYNLIISSDKFTYVFGNFIPHISLILVMAMRLIIKLKIQAGKISSARKCAGRGGTDLKNSRLLKVKAESAFDVVSSLTSWALEGGVVTSDSMRSRGYGSGKRTNFAVFNFCVRDRALLVFFVFLLILMIIFTALGGAAASYTPQISFAGTENLWFIPCMATYAIFLSIPVAIDIAEVLKWRVLKSKI